MSQTVSELTAQRIAVHLIDAEKADQRSVKTFDVDPLWCLTVPDLSESARLILEWQKADQDVGIRLIDEAVIVFSLKVLVSIRL